MTRAALRFAAVFVFALGTSACSTLDSAYNDVLGDDTSTPAADQNGFPPDAAPPRPRPTLQHRRLRSGQRARQAERHDVSRRAEGCRRFARRRSRARQLQRGRSARRHRAGGRAARTRRRYDDRGRRDAAAARARRAAFGQRYDARRSGIRASTGRSRTGSGGGGTDGGGSTATVLVGWRRRARTGACHSRGLRSHRTAARRPAGGTGYGLCGRRPRCLADHGVGRATRL